MKVLNNLNQLEVLIKELVEVLRKTLEDNSGLMIEVRRLEKVKREYEDALKKALQKVEEMMEEVQNMKE